MHATAEQHLAQAQAGAGGRRCGRLRWEVVDGGPRPTGLSGLRHGSRPRPRPRTAGRRRSGLDGAPGGRWSGSASVVGAAVGRGEGGLGLRRGSDGAVGGAALLRAVRRRCERAVDAVRAAERRGGLRVDVGPLQRARRQPRRLGPGARAVLRDGVRRVLGHVRQTLLGGCGRMCASACLRRGEVRVEGPSSGRAGAAAGARRSTAATPRARRRGRVARDDDGADGERAERQPGDRAPAPSGTDAASGVRSPARRAGRARSGDRNGEPPARRRGSSRGRWARRAARCRAGSTAAPTSAMTAGTDTAPTAAPTGPGPGRRPARRTRRTPRGAGWPRSYGRSASSPST